MKDGISPRLLTLKEVLRYCNMTKAAFQKRCSIQPSFVVGKRQLFDKAAIDKWIDSHSKLPGTESNLVDDWDEGKDAIAKGA